MSHRRHVCGRHAHTHEAQVPEGEDERRVSGRWAGHFNSPVRGRRGARNRGEEPHQDWRHRFALSLAEGLPVGAAQQRAEVTRAYHAEIGRREQRGWHERSGRGLQHHAELGWGPPEAS